MAKKYSATRAATGVDDGDFIWKGSKGTSCYYTHPALKFTAEDGVEYEIYGGSGTNPIVLDAQVYIGFGTDAINPNMTYPWMPGYKPVTVIHYPIVDMEAPKNAKSFRKLVDWTCQQLREGRKVHAGCMGGHGRTGTFLAAVVSVMTGMADPIGYVRKNYCKKAVETYSQIKFLQEHYACAGAEITKKFATATTVGAATGSYWDNSPGGGVNGYQGSSGGSTKKKSVGFTESLRDINAVASPKQIW